MKSRIGYRNSRYSVFAKGSFPARFSRSSFGHELPFEARHTIGSDAALPAVFDFNRIGLKIPQLTARAAVQSNKVYPPI
jgi:hypothetical protein